MQYKYKLFLILLTIFNSFIIVSCGVEQHNSIEPAVLTQPCPTVGQISIMIQNKDNRKLSEALEHCITQKNINGVYNEIYSDSFAYKYLVEALAAYGVRNNFEFVLNKRHEMSHLDPDVSYLLDIYETLSANGYPLYQEVMQCCVNRGKKILPVVCLDTHANAISKSPVRDTYRELLIGNNFPDSLQPGTLILQD